MKFYNWQNYSDRKHTGSRQGRGVRTKDRTQRHTRELLEVIKMFSILMDMFCNYICQNSLNHTLEVGVFYCK